MSTMSAIIQQYEAQFPEPLRMSEEEYLAFETGSEAKHEYELGSVWAMAGTSDEHNIISLNIAAELRAQLRGRPCQVFIADLRCKTITLKRPNYYYPDVMVACDPTDNDRYMRERPALVCEVLSPTTARLDEHKFLFYQQNSALQFYLLVAQDKVLVRVMRKAGDEWLYEELQDRTALLKLDAIGCQLSLAQVYEGIDFNRAK
jgi:Uma2 family endonuclease